MVDASTLEALQNRLGVYFKDKQLLETALTHSSFAHQRASVRVSDNERMEFLGDAVLKLVISEYLYTKFPHSNEGDLTKIRAKIVSDKNLAGLAKKIQLGEHIRFSAGEKHSGGAEKTSNLANAFESILGAIYLDQGINPAKRFLEGLLATHFEALIQEDALEDYKTKLQEWMQRQQKPLPIYTILALEGPDHQRRYRVQVTLEFSPPRHYPGDGDSKKEAEQRAAKAAWMDNIH